VEQLSLLGLELPPQVALVEKSDKKVPMALDDIDSIAAFSVPKMPTQADKAPVPAGLWQHPQANRHAVLQGQRVDYHFRRGQRRSIGFSIGGQGLTVSAPRWVTLGAVDAALQTKAAWVLRKLHQVGQQHDVLQGARLVWVDGVQLAWLGGRFTVRLGEGGTLAANTLPAHPSALVSAAAKVPMPRTAGARQGLARMVPGNGLMQPEHGAVLHVALPLAASASQLQDAVQAWMMQAAHAHFVQRLDHFAPLLGVRWTSLRLSGATTRWGSAKQDGSIRLHWRLMQFGPEVVDYVVAHELAHLRHMDHSPRFWQTVATVVPGWAELRARLRGERLPPW
jgi:hypothetical protein